MEIFYSGRNPVNGILYDTDDYTCHLGVDFKKELS